ncbi:MAG: hypothetical protein MRECE_6c056 [Mycoplasmataceae bacterium CE_OT135]|nr:MAG: hypothetical protein MRECE_6c056 [Mycoplasmataceae bacterium CE_OT135]
MFIYCCFFENRGHQPNAQNKVKYYLWRKTTILTNFTPTL